MSDITLGEGQDTCASPGNKISMEMRDYMEKAVKKKKKHRPYIWFMLPGLIFYCAFMIVPLIANFFLSFASWNGVGEISFVGLDNFTKLFMNPENASTYWNAFGNNIKFILCEYFIVVPGGNCLFAVFQNPVAQILSGHVFPAVCPEYGCYRILCHHIF